MQAHKKQIKKRVYKAGEVIEIPTIKRIKKHTYERTTSSFKIHLNEGGILYGVYLK